MRKIYLVIIFTLFYPPLIYGDTNIYPVGPDTYKELVNLRNVIIADATHVIESTNKSTEESEKNLLKTVTEHFQAIDTELATFITLLPVSSYHDLASLLDKPDFDNTTHNIPALEFINVQCSLSIRYLNKKIDFIKKQIGVTNNPTVLLHLGKLEKHLENVIKTLNQIHSHLDVLLNNHKEVTKQE